MLFVTFCNNAVVTNIAVWSSFPAASWSHLSCLFVSPSCLKLCIHVTGNSRSCRRRTHLHIRVVRPSGIEIQELYCRNET
jgi:hypothetical protein